MTLDSAHLPRVRSAYGCRDTIRTKKRWFDAVPQSLSRKLRETLGDDAGGDLVTWLEEEREERARLRTELREDMRAMEARLSVRMDRLELRISDVQSNLMKWSFVFWCGAVAAVAALAGVLRG